MLEYATRSRGASDAAVANSFIQRLLDHIDSFQVAPNCGTLREDLRPGLRIVGWRRTVTIAFRVDEATATVTILAVLYRGRDVAAGVRKSD